MVKKNPCKQGFCGSKWSIGKSIRYFDLLSHLLDEYFQLHTGGGDIG